MRRLSKAISVASATLLGLTFAACDDGREPASRSSPSAHASGGRLCGVASDYVYYAEYSVGEHGPVADGAPLKALGEATSQTVESLIPLLEGSHRAQAEKALESVQSGQKIAAKANFRSKNLSESQVEAQMRNAQKVNKYTRHLYAWLTDQCGDTVGFGGRPTDAPAELPE